MIRRYVRSAPYGLAFSVASYLLTSTAIFPVVLADVPPAQAAAPTGALAALSVPAGPVVASTDKPTDPRQVVLGAMRAELDRSMKQLRLPSYEAPYFVGYTVRDYESCVVDGKFGALYQDGRNRTRQSYVEVRVGGYDFDNTAHDPGSFGGGDFGDFERYIPSELTPLDDSVEALRGTLWLLTDYKYKQALSSLNRKRGQRATLLVDEPGVASFSRIETGKTASKFMDTPRPLTFDRPAWQARIRKLSGLVRSFPGIFDASVRVTGDRLVRYQVTSEGTELVTERRLYAVHMQATARAADGMVLEHEKSFYASAERDLPDEAGLEAGLRKLISELEGLAQAPLFDPYTGPAILLPQAAGVFFHEALGHRLEGERQRDEKEGRTFKGQLGKQVLPSFISVLDDPTLQRFENASLNGTYRFDDEGTAAEPVMLVDHGVLKSYLMSRTPILGSPRSNGHGRAEGSAKPMARMAITMVKSDRQVSLEKLKDMLLQEVRRQKKPYGLIIGDIVGGSTNTTNYDYQAFKGTARVVYRVDAKTGKEALVRGIEFVGTPLLGLSKLVATSNQSGLFNGYCGAESGFVPVTTVAPAVLLSEIELQRSKQNLERPIILPPPWK